jgi:hypothetical protein
MRSQRDEDLNIMFFPKESAMARWAPEPTLSELLADPLVQTVMQAYRVDPDELEADLLRTAAMIKPPFFPARSLEGLCRCA